MRICRRPRRADAADGRGGRRPDHGGGVDAKAFAELAGRLRYISGDYEDAGTFARLRQELGEAKNPLLRLGRAFELDGELAERLAQIEGLTNVSLTARQGTASLRLVA